LLSWETQRPGGQLARINIEDSIYKDKRFIKLCIKFGDRRTAIGALVEAWTLAQSLVHWHENPRAMIPESLWIEQELSTELIELGFAVREGSKIYMRGAEDQFEWLKQKQEAGSKGGVAKSEKAKQRNVALLDKNLATLEKNLATLEKGGAAKSEKAKQRNVALLDKNLATLEKNLASLGGGCPPYSYSYSYSKSKEGEGRESGGDVERQQQPVEKFSEGIVEKSDQNKLPVISPPLPMNYRNHAAQFDNEKLKSFAIVLNAMATDFSYPRFNSRNLAVRCSTSFANAEELLDWAEHKAKVAEKAKHKINGASVFANLSMELRERGADAI